MKKIKVVDEFNSTKVIIADSIASVEFSAEPVVTIKEKDSSETYVYGSGTHKEVGIIESDGRDQVFECTEDGLKKFVDTFYKTV